MKREWKPGDVALVMAEGGERIGFRCGVPSNMGWEYAREPGQKTWSSDDSGYVKPIRPLVVIDPELREQADRLADALIDAMCKSDPGWDKARAYEVRSHMRTALREFANPTPPRPDEPTGLGAVVEDVDGDRWVLYTNPRNDAPWCDGSASVDYADISAVRVLSEGIQP